MKYIALLALAKIVPEQPHLVAAHEEEILSSLEDEDMSIRVRCLDLMTSMVRDACYLCIQAGFNNPIRLPITICSPSSNSCFSIWWEETTACHHCRVPLNHSLALLPPLLSTRKDRHLPTQIQGASLLLVIRWPLHTDWRWPREYSSYAHETPTRL